MRAERCSDASRRRPGAARRGTPPNVSPCGRRRDRVGALRGAARLTRMADPTTSGSDGLRRSPLHERHLALGAKTADFGGWLMPIEYPGGGVVREHTAVRERVGVFDVSHLGKALVRGPGAVALVNSTLTADLDRIAAGQAQYTLCCDPSGGVVDDLIAYRRSDDEVLLVPNAANTAEVVRRLRAAARAGVEVTDEHETYGVLAVQGPASDAVLTALGLPVGHDYMSFVDASWRGPPGGGCRTRFTGGPGDVRPPRPGAPGGVWDAPPLAPAAARG